MKLECWDQNTPSISPKAPSGTDYEFRVPTQRREQPVSGEELSGEIQGESGESQPAESKDDAEARRDFWSLPVTLRAEGRNIPYSTEIH